MTTRAKASKGLLLKREGVLIAEVTSVSGPNGTLTVIDVTSHDSTAVERIGGMPDSGEISFDFNWVGSDAAQQALEADRVATTVSDYTLTLNDHATNKSEWAFSALVSSFSLNPGGVNDKLSGSCTLSLSGATTKTYAPA